MLVFLHHGLGSVAQWRDFPRRLAEATGCPALVYDRTGHGQSPPLTAPRSVRYHYEEAGRLHELLEGEAIADFILVGHSDGGTIALIYPSLGGVQPRGIVCEAAHVFVENCTREGIRQVLATWRDGLRHKLERYHGSKTDALFLNWSGVWLSPDFDGFNCCDLLPRVACPVLALQGSEDPYGSSLQPEAIAKYTGAAIAEIPECGHDPHQERPERTLSVMAEWIRAVTLAPAVTIKAPRTSPC